MSTAKPDIVTPEQWHAAREALLAGVTGPTP
jgi:hypothetical protein